MNSPKRDPLHYFIGKRLAYSCIDCGAQMVIRLNREQNTLFLGCNRYPDCKHTEEIPESVRMEILGQQKFSGF